MMERYYTVAKTITRWKIDTPFENWLGRKADKSLFWKKLYVLYYRIFDGEYYKKGLLYIEKEINRQIYGNEVLKSVGGGILRLDMIYSLHRFGVSFEEYFIYKFYNLNADGRRKYNSLKMQYGYCELVNDESIRNLFEDKGNCYQLFKPFYKRDLVVIKDEQNIDALKFFLSKHQSFIYKPINGHSGIGIKIYRDFDYNDSVALDNLVHYGDGQFIVEELINQASGMAVLHPESINTIRIATFSINKRVEFIGAALRMGTGKSNVDNAGSGGIYASVNIEEGIVDSVAINNVGEIFVKHPDTKVIFPGYRIPEWDKAIDLVKQMATTVKGATMISWDLAYSDKGWLMIEGNDVGEAYLLQAPLQQPIKQKIIEYIDKFMANTFQT